MPSLLSATHVRGPSTSAPFFTAVVFTAVSNARLEDGPHPQAKEDRCAALGLARTLGLHGLCIKAESVNPPSEFTRRQWSPTTRMNGRAQSLESASGP